MLANILSYGIGTLIAFAVIGALAFVFIRDITQKKHSVLRNYPVIGRFRYFFEQLGEYFRQYFFAGDRDEMPFNRATRGWVYRLAKNEGGIIGFGSTYDLHHPGALIFVNHPFPVLEEERQPTPLSLRAILLIGEEGGEDLIEPPAIGQTRQLVGDCLTLALLGNTAQTPYRQRQSNADREQGGGCQCNRDLADVMHRTDEEDGEARAGANSR